MLLVAVFAVSPASAQEEPSSPSPAPEPPPPSSPAPPPPPASPAPAPAPSAPFAWGDFTWVNGQSRQKDFPLKPFGDAVTLSLYLDVNYAFSANHPIDDTLTGTASIPRHNEIEINLASVGFEWNYRNVIGRLSLQYGSMLTIVQDLDGTAQRGRDLSIPNLSYIREATAGYHFDVGHGINAEAGIFLSYIGLESYLLAENWNYTRSVLCDATPFYFQGIRVQYFPTDRIKIEPWLMNGWQTFGKWNYAPAGGLALRWAPTESLYFIANSYVGTDIRGQPSRIRFHNDNSAVVRYFNDSQASFLSKAAVSINNHLGFEAGGSADLPGPSGAHVVGTAVVNRVWFYRDHLALSVRGEVFSNPSRYLASYPPPGFVIAGGIPALQIWGVTGTFDVMPTDFMALRFEANYRRSNLPYFAGPGGTTSPDGFLPTPDGFVPDAVKDQLLGVVAVNFRL
ncbi:Outer membrane protein [Labilithrix luteola]|uniref:Outer membrane protein n=1 Tax=Labilithrix luteola TaxID=1391654 RepID=A0A0K1QC01_9BACT|nr:Outer membrane protein [Labilithrix luteola]